MHYGIEVLMSNGWQDRKANTMELELSRRNIVRTTIDSYLVTASNKSCCEMLCESFKAPVAGRYSAGSKNGDVHLFVLSPVTQIQESGF